MSNSEDRKNETVYVVVDRVTLGYITAVTKENPKIVMCNLRDLCSHVLERAQNKKYGTSWGYVNYPGIELRLKAKAQSGHNRIAARQAEEHARKMFCQETGVTFDLPRSRKNNRLVRREHANKVWSMYQEWMKVHPEYKVEWRNYTGLMVEFSVVTRDNDQIMMSQDEIETVLVEQILLLDPVAQAEEDESEEE